MASRIPSKARESREDRLKAALKANMARRKAQARLRSKDTNGAQDATGTRAAKEAGEDEHDG